MARDQPQERAVVQERGDKESADARAQQRARGRYLVHHVAMCVECHSPRQLDGSLVPHRELTGGRIPVPPPFAGQPWALLAPRLAGLPGWERHEIVTLLHKGHRPDGTRPRPPMPPFRMQEEDARAEVSYLTSLRPVAAAPAGRVTY